MNTTTQHEFKATVDALSFLVAENERLKTALQYIADRKWAANTIKPAKFIYEFCDVASEALQP